MKMSSTSSTQVSIRPWKSSEQRSTLWDIQEVEELQRFRAHQVIRDHSGIPDARN